MPACRLLQYGEKGMVLIRLNQDHSGVEVPGFEPGAFWSRTKRATKLRYTSPSRSWDSDP